jgi:hypothetical protein
MHPVYEIFPLAPRSSGDFSNHRTYHDRLSFSASPRNTVAVNCYRIPIKLNR